MLEAKKNFLKNEEGQGLMEMLLFLPFLLMLYQITLSMGNAINGSINQQKFTRAYHYARVRNNSMLPSPQVTKGIALEYYGLYFTGWAKEFEGGANIPIAPCYPFKTLLKTEAEEKCEDNYSTPSTQNIRVMTAYGVCPQTIQRTTNGWFRASERSWTDIACTNQ